MFWFVTNKIDNEISFDCFSMINQFLRNSIWVDWLTTKFLEFDFAIIIFSKTIFSIKNDSLTKLFTTNCWLEKTTLLFKIFLVISITTNFRFCLTLIALSRSRLILEIVDFVITNWKTFYIMSFLIVSFKYLS